MPEFTITRYAEAPVEALWEILNNFGEISEWNSRVTRSGLTSDGPVSEGTTRYCNFSPLGSVNERIDTYVPQERMTVNIYETFKLPISGAVADFSLSPDDHGTELTIHYSYTLNRMGRVAKTVTGKQMHKGINGLADDLVRASEQLGVS